MDITLSTEMMIELKKQTHSDIVEQSIGNPLYSIMGMSVRASNMFPFIVACSSCNGSGDGGEQSTYCQTCKGGGSLKHNGLVTETVDGPLTAIVSYLPKLFEPSFPFALPMRPLPRR